jgi:Flp pilus assembly protein TadD
MALEQLASVHADAGDARQLEGTVEAMRKVAPDATPTRYYHAVSALLAGRAGEASALAERVMTADPQYAPIYDLAGAAYVKLGQAARARDAFLASLRFDARDSTAYTNLGLLELAAGNHEAAEGYFAEALWLVPESPVARDGLARAQAARRRP